MPKLLSYPDIKWKEGTIPEGELIAVDCETTGLNPYGTKDRLPDRVFIFQFANEEGEIGVVTNTKENFPMLKEFFEKRKISKIFHNLQFDVKFIELLGARVRGKIHDTLIQSRLCNEYAKSHRLEDLAIHHCNFKDLERQALLQWFAEQKIKVGDRDYSKVPKKIMYPYAAVDAWNCMQLHYVFSTPMEEIKKSLYKTEIACARYMIQQENRGILIDQKYLKDKSKRISKKCKALIDKVKVRAGCKLELSEKGQYSARDIGFALFMAGEKCIAWSEKSKQPKLDKETLEQYDVPFIKSILKYRKSERRKKVIDNQILAKVDAFGILHSNFNLSAAVTGRFSSSGPSLHTISNNGGVREGFIARPKYTLFYLDYSQIEVRLFAHFAKDEEMIYGFNTDPDFDVHARVALAIGLIAKYGKIRGRAMGKKLNFTMLYGAGAARVAKTLGISVQEAQIILRDYHAKLPALRRLQNRLRTILFDHEFIEDPFGRRYRVPSDLSYKAPNALIQGTACGILKKAMLRCKKILGGTRSHMIQNIHDELVFEIHDDEWYLVPLLKEAMEDKKSFAVKITVDIAYGKVWGLKKEVENESIFNRPSHIKNRSGSISHR